MRAIVLTAGLLGVLAGPGRADECGDQIDRVVAATQATLTKRSHDFAELDGPDGMTLTLACGDPSAVGVQFRGAAPPAAYFALFGRAGQAIAGLAPGLVEDAARRAQEKAVAARHSHVDAGHALVTCSVSALASGPVTACALIDKGDRE